MIQLVLPNLPAQSIPMYPQYLRRPRLISVQPFQHTLDEFLLELRHRFFEQNSTIDHHADQRFQLIFHVCAPGSNPGDLIRP
jgi:hypothetical protein